MTQEIEDRINKIIEESILPSVQMHGGHVELQSFKDGIATIFLSGACSGCAMSTQTLKMGIENTLKHFIPEVKVVHGEEDQHSTVDPYMSYDSWGGVPVAPPRTDPPTSKDNPNSMFNKKD